MPLSFFHNLSLIKPKMSISLTPFFLDYDPGPLYRRGKSNFQRRLRMRGSRLLLILALVMVGFFACYTSSHAQSKGKTAQQKIEGSKVGQDMRDVQKNAPATFDGTKSTQTPSAVQVQTSTTTPTVTPAPRGQYVPKQYQSLKTTAPPSPTVTPSTSTATSSSSSSKSSGSSSSSSSSTPKKK